MHIHDDAGAMHVADSDPWLGVTWKVYLVQGVEGGYLKPDGKQGVFTLTPEPATGPTLYYTANFQDGDMPSCWGPLRLFPRGNLPFAPPTPLLTPWPQSGDAPWVAAADAVRQGLNVSMARLEGDLYPDANARALTLVCVPNATTAGTPLLVLKLVSATSAGQAQPMDNPTGGGSGDN
jgi:hypothetical protein